MITLKSQRDIKAVFNQKNRLDCEDFYTLYIKNSLGYPRFGFVASRKFFKRAVDRNRAKRLLRQAVRSAIRVYKDLGYDILFIAKVSILKKKSYHIVPEVVESLEKIKRSCL